MGLDFAAHDDGTWVQNPGSLFSNVCVTHDQVGVDLELDNQWNLAVISTRTVTRRPCFSLQPAAEELRSEACVFA